VRNAVSLASLLVSWWLFECI